MSASRRTASRPASQSRFPKCGGKTEAPVSELLESLSFDLLSRSAGGALAVLPMTVVSPARFVKHSSEGAGWEATLTNSLTGLTVTVAGLLEFDSYLEMNVTLTAGLRAVELTCSGLTGNSGTESGLLAPLSWHWSNTTGDNLVWVGKPAGGIFLKLKGEGDDWNNPLYGKDYPIVLFVPKSWGGATPLTAPGGINVTETIASFCGPQKLAAGESLSFLFDLAFTPSKPVDMVAHYKQRYLQLGYGGTPYLPADEVQARGATVMTLHQGISELVNAEGAVDPEGGKMVNPYINFPFNSDTVQTLAAISEQAHDRDLTVKFYCE